MSRKRFVKLLMSVGYSRNRAVREAQMAVRNGTSYLQAWRYLEFEYALKSVGIATEEACFGFYELSKAAMATGMSGMLFGESLRRQTTLLSGEIGQ